jgi:hypothetical protein
MHEAGVNWITDFQLRITRSGIPHPIDLGSAFTEPRRGFSGIRNPLMTASLTAGHLLDLMHERRERRR